MFGALQLLRSHEVLPRALSKPGPPVSIATRLVSFRRAQNEVAHRGSIHVILSSGHASVASGTRLSALAARAGDLPALRWMHTHGCAWDEITAAKAAEGDQLQALRYLRSMGCAWSALTCLSLIHI